MNFPFSYTGEMVFYKPNDFNFEVFIKNIIAKVELIEQIEEQIQFSMNVSFSKLPIKVTFTFRDENTSVYCKYKISMLENNLVFLLATLFSVFLSHFHKPALGYLAFIFGILFYFFNTIKISNAIKSIIYDQIGGKTDVGTPELWQQQQKWMKDKTCCPACGELINSYANKCISCGLFFDNKQKKINRTNTTSSVNTEIVYELRKTKK